MLKPKCPSPTNFNPRSLAGATDYIHVKAVRTGISIHAPSRERPQWFYNNAYKDDNFNPRSLAGATLVTVQAVQILHNFNPRSLAGATLQNVADVYRVLQFQSTLPRGSDPADAGSNGAGEAISIHAPSRERPTVLAVTSWLTLISIHAPSRERPVIDLFAGNVEIISIHAPSRERPKISKSMRTARPISIHAPSRERPRPHVIFTTLP